MIIFDLKSEVHSQRVNYVYTFRLTVVGVEDSARYSISETTGMWFYVIYEPFHSQVFGMKMVFICWVFAAIAN
jgi:hypothetical protein